VRALFFLAIAGVVTGCSLVSGWSDLQGGAADGGARDARVDAARASDAAATDASASAVRCGAARCTGELVCCDTSAGTLACSTRALCDGIILSCTERAGCAANEVCCLDTSGFVAACSATCPLSAGASALCIPDNPSGCFPGQSCVSISATQLSECQ
jgi:hypothetical protein